MGRGPASGSTEAVLDLWRLIAEQPKTVLGWPQWSQVPRLQPGTKVTSSRLGLRSAAAETTEAVVQLADLYGIGLEGVRLRMTAWAFKPRHDVTATLEVPGGHSFVTIARIDAWPSSPHMNSLKALKHPALKSLPAQIDYCHVHRFSDNAHLGRAAFAPDGNLPVAASLPNPLGSFRDFLRTIAAEFRIDGAEDFEAPDWQEML